jgi:hypothetical protein
MYRIYNYVLGMDPSGSYNEGKGTTGLCVMRTADYKILSVGSISAKNYTSDRAYWDEHIKTLNAAVSSYRSDIVLSVEDYVLYKNKAMSQSQSTMETSQLLGVLKYSTYLLQMPYYTRNASVAKVRWTPEILEHKRVIYKGTDGKWYAHCRPDQALLTHELDAIKHAMYFAMFENGQKAPSVAV